MEAAFRAVENTGPLLVESVPGNCDGGLFSTGRPIASQHSLKVGGVVQREGLDKMAGAACYHRSMNMA